jgi:hypothetical protein
VVNVVAATSPVGGPAQLAVMSVSVAVKLVALWLLLCRRDISPNVEFNAQ